MLSDLRRSIRLLAKSPGAALVAAVSLALGIGANTTIFSLLDAVVLRPLPVARADRLVDVAEARYFTVTYPSYRDLAAQARTLDGLAAFAPRTGSITAAGLSVVESIQVASGNYFGVLGVAPALGRAFDASDDGPGADPVIVLSHAFWQRWFAGDTDVVGRALSINGSPFVVAGIAPRGFKGTTIGADPAGWIPIAAWPRMATGAYLQLDLNSRNWGWLRMIGRIRDGVEVEQVRAELRELAAAERRAFPDASDGFNLTATPLRAAATGLRTRADLTRFIALLVGVVLAVLGVACANVSGLLLARATERRRELAVRLALGATRGRIVRELLADSLLLAAIGGGAGILVAMWTLDLLRKVSLPGGIDLSRVELEIGSPALAVTALVALASVLLFGLAPAIQAARADVAGALNDRPFGGRVPRPLARGALVAVQVSFSLVLLVGTALFARTLASVLASDLGFEPRGVAYAATNLSLQRYSGERALAFYDDVLARLGASRAIRSAGWTRLIPGGGEDVETVAVPGYVPPDGRTPTVGANAVSAGYFEAMGIPILRGRGFTQADTPRTAPVAVVSEAAARRFWKGDAVGRRFTIHNMEVTVVGVARDVPPAPGASPEPFVYGNVMQHPAAAQGPLYLVSRAADRRAGAIVPAIVEAMRAAGPDAPIVEARTMEDQLLDILAPQRSAAALLGLLSAIALAMSAAGVYAMVSYWVTQRTREFGLRMALGASATSIRALAFRHSAAAVGGGVVLGLPVAFGLGHLSRTMLFGVSALDPASFGGAVAVLGMVALAATFLAARRAASASPLEALRRSSQ